MAIFKLKIASFSHYQNKSYKLFFFFFKTAVLNFFLFFSSAVLLFFLHLLGYKMCQNKDIGSYSSHFTISVMDSFTEIQGLFFFSCFLYHSLTPPPPYNHHHHQQQQQYTQSSLLPQASPYLTYHPAL